MELQTFNEGLAIFKLSRRQFIPAMVDLKESEYDSLSYLFMEEAQGVF